jgi:glutathione S-transferase
VTILRILGRANSFNVRKVLWVCDELGIDYTLSINPIGLVPAVIDDGQVLRESNTIVRYLSTKYGGDALYPKDPIQRARVEQWIGLGKLRDIHIPPRSIPRRDAQ